MKYRVYRVLVFFWSLRVMGYAVDMADDAVDRVYVTSGPASAQPPVPSPKYTLFMVDLGFRV